MRLESFLIFGLVFLVKLAVTDANPSSQVDNNFPSYGHTSCSKTCGHIIRTNDIPTFRILDGNEVEIEKSPWYASILSKYPSCENRLSNRMCTAILIGNQWLLTAAHCTTFRSDECTPGVAPSTVSLRPDNITVRVGIGSSKEQTLEVERIFWDDLYEARTQRDITEFDLVLLKLKTILEFNEYVGWICVPYEPLNVNEAKKSGKVAGYGLMNRQHFWEIWHDSHYESPTLREDTLEIETYSSFGSYTAKSDTEILAHGGFTIEENHVNYLYGIFSNLVRDTHPYEYRYVAVNSYCNRLYADTNNMVHCVDKERMSPTCDEEKLPA